MKEINNKVGLAYGRKFGHPPDVLCKPSFSLVFLPESLRACGLCVPSKVSDVADVSLSCSFVGSTPSDEFRGFPSREELFIVEVGGGLVSFRNKLTKAAKTR